ncbi:MAG: peptidoglycan bridge formation glycyltransferase FemA/FemB family protein [Firmicutes bacterium]|nr:peptidoglycan bridge formation glycyltransferase FemA/FemB family protein [Bacillota bacterium]MBQ6842620.1 peptidoglycan bridge formation glycyltransferase FemA/FemB family protein [Bacillota bacterium]MBR6823647.1 peptidoglycan bridge formation glycyltransferase FemA/FemB family protein [Bacillota bacterium]MBR7113482.1 peptidoglycan bridge formation glycyltransferase FemA/FemB family protein [Bacillota bacterium]
MLSYRLLDITEKDYFNRFITDHAKGHLLQTWEWGDLKGSGAWQPLRLVVEDEQGIRAAVSLLKRPLPAGMGSMFYATRGPVLDIADQEAWDVLWQGVKAVAKQHNCIFCKFDPDVPDTDELWQQRIANSGARSCDKGPGFEGIQPRYVFRLDIRPDEEQLLANFHQKTRYNLRLAERKGVTVEENCGKDQLPAFYKLLKETADRDRFLIRPYSYYEAFYDILMPAKMGELFMVYYEGQPIAGALTFLLGDKAWYIYGASSNAHRNVMPNYLMQWRMIQWAKRNGCTMYDFRGVPGDVGEDHPLYGLVKFKRGFGGDYIRFIGEFDMVYRPFMYRFYHFIEPKYQVAVRKLIRLKRKLRGGK